MRANPLKLRRVANDQKPAQRGETGEPRLWHIGAALSVTFAAAALGLAGLTWLAWVLLRHPKIPHPGVISLHDTVGILQLVFASVAGAGALVALIMAYRRQKIAEGDSVNDRTRVFNERFTTIAAQLGDDHPAVRLAGVHAMAGLADDWKSNRQTCVDVLCAYLRMPYEPDPGEKAPAPERLAFRADREVRRTVVRVITAHLNGGATVSWRGLNFDFTGVVFDGGSFRGAEFSGGLVDFTSAEFSGGSVDLGMKFSGGTVRFGRAKFSGGMMAFTYAEFSGGQVDFTSAEFSGGWVDFTSAKFRGSQVRFGGAKFSGGLVRFAGAEFSGGQVDFGDVVSGAKFSGAQVDFGGAEFSGAQVGFGDVFGGDGGAEFSGGLVRFGGAKFSGGTVDFTSAKFCGGQVDFGGAKFSGARVRFGRAEFSGGLVRFAGAEFSSGTVDFGDVLSGAKFSGAQVDFGGAEFSGARVDFGGGVLGGGAEFSGGTVDFGGVSDWSHPPTFDRDIPPPAAVVKLPGPGSRPV